MVVSKKKKAILSLILVTIITATIAVPWAHAEVWTHTDTTDSDWQGTLNDVIATNGNIELKPSSFTGTYLSKVFNINTGEIIDSSISWNATVPTNTSIAVETNVSLDGGNSWLGWHSVSNGGSIPDLTPGVDASNAKLQYRATLSTSDISVTPSLHDVTITIDYNPIVQPPEAPELSVTLSNNYPELTWTSIEGATSYIVERSTDGTNFIQLKEIDQTNYIDQDIMGFGQTYYYRVIAKNESGTSPPSNVESVTITLPAPELTVSLEDNDAVLNWDPVACSDIPLQSSNVDWPRGTEATIRFKVSGSTFEGYFNGTKVIDFTDPELISQQGLVGLRQNDRHLGWQARYLEFRVLSTGYCDSFDSNSMDNYTQYAYEYADWVIDTDAGTLTATGGVQAVLTKNDTSLTDTDIEVDVDSADDGGIVARFVDNYNYYLLTIRDDSTQSGCPNLELYKRVHNTSYIIERSTDGTNFIQLAEVSQTTYTDPDLSSGTYYYRVKAKKGTCQSSYSNVVSVTIEEPTPPTFWVYWPKGGQYVKVDWVRNDANLEGKMVQLWRKDTISGIWLPVKEIKQNEKDAFEWLDKQVTAGINYKYQVRVYDSVTWEWRIAAESNWAELERPFEAPGGLQIVSKTDTSATVTWNIIEGAATYQVQTSTDNGATWQSQNVGGPPVTVPRPSLVRVKAGTHQRSQWSGILTVN